MTSAVDHLKERFVEMSQPDPDGVYREGARKRAARTEFAMQALSQLWEEACAAVPFEVPERGLGLAAVGSLARGQVGPSSDLDLVLMYDSRALKDEQLNEFANRLWYPIWDSGLDLDHAVRTRAQCESVTDHDLPAAMSWLDVRGIAGDVELIQETSVSILERWRKAVRKRLPELLGSAQERLDRFGRMQYVNQPDIKQSRGGLRDTVLTSALAASWLADRPHGRYDDMVERLLDVRDCIHLAAGKDTNLLLPQYQADVARMMGLADPTLPEDERAAKSIDDLQTLLARVGRTVAFSLDSTASRAERTLVHDKPRFSFFQLRKPQSSGRREAPKFEILDVGLAKHEGEIVLAPGVSVASDANLPLRAAVVSARSRMPVNTSTLVNLTHAPISDSAWDEENRALFLELIGSGSRLVEVWEELDFVGLPSRWIPEWAAIRNRPSASAAHRYTIDRHMVEVTSHLGRKRPVMVRGAGGPGGLGALGDGGYGERDGHGGHGEYGEYDDAHYQALLLAGILHDIGKRPGIADHAAEGERHARVILARMGFEPQIIEWTCLLVREHLTLSEFARGKNPNDPEVAAELASRVNNDPVLLDMLFDITRADMSALGATSGESIAKKIGWSKWNEQLVTNMAIAARKAMVL